MRRNEAQRLTLKDQIDEAPMEARIAKLESDVDHIKTDVSELRKGMQAANDSIIGLSATVADLATKVAGLTATIPHLATKADLNAVEGKLSTRISALESKLMKWCIGTALAVASLAFSIAKLVH